MKVQELIDQNTKWCDRDLLEKIFAQAEGKVINKILTSYTNHKEVLIWRGTTTTEFSICCAYHMEKERQDSFRGECSIQQSMSKIWRII